MSNFDNTSEITLTAGTYASSTVFDDDERRDALTFYYVHSIDDGVVDLWSFNTSPRFIRKGGDEMIRYQTTVDETVKFFSNGFTNTATPMEISKVLTDYVKVHRQRFISDIVSAETESLIDDVFYAGESNSIIEDHQEFMKTAEVIDQNIYKLTAFGS